MLFHELEKVGAPVDGLSMALMVAGVVAHVGTDMHKEVGLPQLSPARRSCRSATASPTPAATSPRPRHARCATATSGSSTVARCGRPWPTRPSWILLLTRTNLDVPKHKGLTMFLLPMDTPGITVEPVHTMGTERTNATFYDDVRIGDEWRIGDVDGGWKVMGVALAFERGRDGRHRRRDPAAAPLPRVGRARAA